ncbi:MAG: menaquinone biosynthesis protein [Planctomycetota bacterium]|jgi:chorismate dehydratase
MSPPPSPSTPGTPAQDAARDVGAAPTRGLNLGTVPYLNARPLVEGLDEQPGVELLADVPSALLARLRAGELDAALVSAVELFRLPALGWVAGPAITSEGPVQSILLYLRVPPEEIRTVALDRSSLSAAAMTRVCLSDLLLVPDATFTDCPPDVPLDAIDADAVLRIGDPALSTAPDGREVLDLGALWTEKTGLPFVYALWLVRPGVAAEPLGSQLRAAAERGLPRRAAMAEAFAAEHGLEVAACREYLTERIGFTLGPAERAGLEAFGRLAHVHGLVDTPVLPEHLA